MNFHSHAGFTWQEFLFIAVFIFIVAIGSRYRTGAAQKRRDGLVKLAQRLGLAFKPDEDCDLANQFGFLKQLAQGESRYAYNALSGKYQNYDVLAFDYHYDASTEKSQRKPEHRFSVFILKLPATLSGLTVRRQNFLLKVAEKFGYQDIQFESAEFAKAFNVRCQNKKFAYDVCNAKMMEYLLANRDLNIEIENQAIALVFNSNLSLSFDCCLPLDKIEFNLQRLIEIRSRLPEYLFTQNT